MEYTWDKEVYKVYFSYHNRLKQLLDTNNYEVIQGTGVFVYRFIFPELGKSYSIRNFSVPEYLNYLHNSGCEMK